MKISVIIPCIPRHIDSLRNVLNDLHQQTVLPQEVVVALSETIQATGIALEQELNTLTNYSLNIRIISDEDKHGPSSNRNRASRECQGDVIAFMDADDRVHPQKVEIIKWVFTNYDTHIFMHGYQSPSSTYVSYSLDSLAEKVYNPNTIVAQTFGPEFKRNYTGSTMILADSH